MESLDKRLWNNPNREHHILQSKLSKMKIT